MIIIVDVSETCSIITTIDARTSANAESAMGAVSMAYSPVVGS